MKYSECIDAARPRIGQFCKACPECNGAACRNLMPGPGAKGVGDTAIRNYNKWKEIRINMDTIAENVSVDTSLEIFGRKFKYPLWQDRSARYSFITVTALMTSGTMIFLYRRVPVAESLHSQVTEPTAMS